MKQTGKYIEYSDESLVNLYKETGNTRYFDELFNRYLKKVENKCYSLLKERELSSEFAVEIMSKAFENLRSFKGNSMFSTWLYSITYNYCIDYLRLKKKMHYPNWNRENDIPEIVDEDYEEMNEMNYQQLLDILEKIHPEEKAMILMKYRDDMPMKMVAQAMRITESAAKMRLKRAKMRILYHYKNKYV